MLGAILLLLLAAMFLLGLARHRPMNDFGMPLSLGTITSYYGLTMVYFLLVAVIFHL